jgi:hypothetical protein
MGIAMMGFMHVYMKYTQPLFIQALMGIKNLYDAKPVHIHLLGRPAVGDLKRPFKVASMFGGMFYYFVHLFWNLMPSPIFPSCCCWPSNRQRINHRGREACHGQEGRVE